MYYRWKNPEEWITHTEARPGEIRRSCGDYNKAKKLLNWGPKVNFKDGLKTFIKLKNKFILMKILIAHELFPPEVSGGGEILIYKLAKELNKNNEVTVITSGNSKLKEFDGVKTVRIPINRYFLNFCIFTILKYAKDCDVIQTTTGNLCLPSFIVAKILDKPICCMVLHHFGEYWIDVRGYFIGSLFKFYENLYIKRGFDAIIFLNDFMKNKLKNKINKKTKMFLIQPGIERNLFIKKVNKKNFVLFVGNFSMDRPTLNIKGFKYLIEAARQLPQIKFVIVGKRKYMDKLKRIFPSNIEFTGIVCGKELVNLFNKALILCAPSLSEGFGFVIAEAMASGCAIISTIDLGQKGILIRPKNTEDIVNSIKYLLDNLNIAKNIGNRNRKISKKFRWDNFFKSILGVYKSII